MYRERNAFTRLRPDFVCDVSRRLVDNSSILKTDQIDPYSEGNLLAITADCCHGRLCPLLKLDAIISLKYGLDNFHQGHLSVML